VELEKALAEYDEYAAAWYLMGRLRVSLDDVEGARQAFEKAIASDAKYLNPYQPLVRMAIQQGRWDDAVQLSSQVLRLNPHVTEAHYFQGVANFNMGRMEAAQKSVEAVQSSNDSKQFPESLRLLGMIQAKQGKFDVAATSFRSFLTSQPASPAAPAIRQQLREWEELGVIQKQETAANPTQP